MANIDETLKDRGSKYGSFEDNARITEQLMDVLKSAPNFNKLHYIHKNCFYMILHKIGRAVCGDPMYIDNPHDIAGYAKGLEDYLNKKDEDKEDGWIEYNGSKNSYQPPVDNGLTVDIKWTLEGESNIFKNVIVKKDDQWVCVTHYRLSKQDK